MVDADYGRNAALREDLERLGLSYGVAMTDSVGGFRHHAPLRR